jgi:hypothetical protein
LEFGLASQLLNSLRELIGMGLFLSSMLHKSFGNRRRVDACRHEIVESITKHAHILGGKRIVQHSDSLLPVQRISLGDWAFFNMPAGSLSNLFDVVTKSMDFPLLPNGTSALLPGSAVDCTNFALFFLNGNDNSRAFNLKR